MISGHRPQRRIRRFPAAPYALVYISIKKRRKSRLSVDISITPSRHGRHHATAVYRTIYYIWKNTGKTVDISINRCHTICMFNFQSEDQIMTNPTYKYSPRGPGGYAVERVVWTTDDPATREIFTAALMAWEPDQAGAENVAAGAESVEGDPTVTYRVVVAPAHNG